MFICYHNFFVFVFGGLVKLRELVFTISELWLVILSDTILFHLYEISLHPDSNQIIKFSLEKKKKKKCHGLWQRQGSNNFIQ